MEEEKIEKLHCTGSNKSAYICFPIKVWDFIDWSFIHFIDDYKPENVIISFSGIVECPCILA